MLAPPQRRKRDLEMGLWRRADRDTVEVGAPLQHRVDVFEVVDAIDPRMAARACGKLERGVAGYGRKMLIPRYFSDTHQPHEPPPHGSSTRVSGSPGSILLELMLLII